MDRMISGISMIGTPGYEADSALTAILVPTIGREFAEIEFLFFLWGLTAQAATARGEAASPDTRLIISLDGAYHREQEAEIAGAFNAYRLQNLFSGLDVVFCDISPEENIYIRPGRPRPERIPRLGLKSGPNTQFFRSLGNLCGSQRTILLNEVDCFPARPDWLHRLKRLVSGSEPFWVLGSPYRGWGRLGCEILTHVNGNALYAVGTPGFADFLRDWEQALADEVTRNPDLAYDILFAYRHAALFNPAQWSGAPIELFRSLQDMLCRIRYTSLIHNVAGEEEISGRARVDLKAYLTTHPETTLIHGRFLKLPILRKFLGEISGLIDEASPARLALRKYLIDASRRLVERGNLDASRSIVELVSGAGLSR